MVVIKDGVVKAMRNKDGVVSILAYVGNLAWLTLFVWLGMHKVAAQAIAIILVTPFNFAGNKLWSFRRDN